MRYEIRLIVPMRRRDYVIFESDSRNIKEWCRIYGASKGFACTKNGRVLSACSLKADASLENPDWEYFTVEW